MTGQTSSAERPPPAMFRRAVARAEKHQTALDLASMSLRSPTAWLRRPAPVTQPSLPSNRSSALLFATFM